MARNIESWQAKMIIHMICSKNRLTTSSIAPIILDALCYHIAEKPGLCAKETAIFLWDEFNILPSSSSVKHRSFARWLDEKESTAKSQRTELSNTRFLPAQVTVSDFRSYHLVFVDEKYLISRDHIFHNLASSAY